MQVLFKLLLEFLEEKLGPAFDASTKEAWVAATGVMAAVLKQAIDELKQS